MAIGSYDKPIPYSASDKQARGVGSEISFRAVSKWFGAAHVLKNINLDVPAGQVCVVCGPSGSGKSTLLRCINGLERPREGEIRVMGSVLSDRVLRASSFRAQIGMVFQRFSLYPHMSVLKNITLAPCRVRGLSQAEAEKRAIRILERVGIPDKAQAFPGELSGGQQQRVAIARALVMEPRIMLFDEPTSALDPEMIREVLDVMRELAATGMTMVTVTHEMGFAREVADRVLFMDEGRVVEDAAASTFFSAPQTDRARQFLDRLLHH